MRPAHWFLAAAGLLGAVVAVVVARRRPPADPASVVALYGDLGADERIPHRVRRHAAETAQAAVHWLPDGWTPGAFGRLLLAILDRESRGGDALASDGTGDHVARKGAYLRRSWARVLDTLPRGWSPPRDRSGNVLPPPYAIPVDGRGWGRSIWQIDFGAHDFARGPGVDDPWGAADYAAKVLYDAVQYWTGRDGRGWSVPALSAASYNAGTDGVKRALDAGLPPDAATTGGDYSADVLAMAAGYGFGGGNVA